MIVYGWYSFKLKTIQQYDVQLDLAWNGGHIEVRQKVFHLFWIPFFPIGKMWLFNGPGGQHYLHDGIIYQIRQQGLRVRTPWYSFALLILIGLGLGAAAINGIYEQQQYKKYREESFRKNTENWKARLAALAPGQILSMEGDYAEGRYDYRYARVIAATPVELRVVTPSSGGSEKMYAQTEIVERLYDSLRGLDTFVIQRSKLSEALPAGPDEEYRYKLASPFGDSNRKYRLDKIYYSQGPDLEVSSTYCLDNGKRISVYFSNHGLPGRILKIRNVKSNYQWTYDEDKYYSIGENGFHLEGSAAQPENEYEFSFDTEDDRGNLVTFIVKGNCEGAQVSRK